MSEDEKKKGRSKVFCRDEQKLLAELNQEMEDYIKNGSPNRNSSQRKHGFSKRRDDNYGHIADKLNETFGRNR